MTKIPCNNIKGSDNEVAFMYAVRVLSPRLKNYDREYKFHPMRKWRFDFAYPEKKVAVEIDGIIWQAGGGRHNTDKDRDKINNAVAMGWRVLRFSGSQIKNDPGECISLLSKTLRIKQKKENQIP